MHEINSVYLEVQQRMLKRGVAVETTTYGRNSKVKETENGNVCMSTSRIHQMEVNSNYISV